MAKGKCLPLGTFLKRFSSEAQCQEYLASLRWQSGYIAQNVAVVTDTGWPTGDISVPNAAIRFR